MRISNTLNYGFAAGLVLLGIWGAEIKAAEQNNGPGAETVISLQGKARFSNDSKSWQPLKKGARLNAGVMIQSAANSTVDLNLNANTGAEESRLRVQADTVLGIERLTAPGLVPDVELDLRAGQIAAHVGRLQPGSRYEIKFANGIVGIRGGDFRMTSSGVVAVHNGEAVVVVVGADGNPTSHVVNAGKQFNAATGRFTEVAPNEKKASKTKPNLEP